MGRYIKVPSVQEALDETKHIFMQLLASQEEWEWLTRSNMALTSCLVCAGMVYHRSTQALVLDTAHTLVDDSL